MKRVLLLSSLAAVLALAGVHAQEGSPAIMRFSLTGPEGWSTAAADKTKTHVYYTAKAHPEAQAGISASQPNTFGPRRNNYSEFIYIVDGSLTLVDKSGREETFRPRDAVIIPRGVDYTWKQTEALRTQWVKFDHATEVSSETSFIRLEPNGPAGTGLKENGSTKSHRYYAGKDRSSTGVWETSGIASDDQREFHTHKYAELMAFIKGEVTLTQPDGSQQTFKAGEVLLVPKGAQFKWDSGTVRKYWVIFDQDPAPSATSQ